MAKKRYPIKSSLLLQRFNRQGLATIWSDLKESLAGSERDFTTIPLSKAVFLLAIPMVLEMIMESLFAVFDIYFVSRLGADAVATVGITESLMTLIYSIAFGLSMGTTALVSRRIGEKNPLEASKESMQAIFAGVIVALMIALPGTLFAKDLLRLMGASTTIVNEYSSYTSIMFGGNIVIMLLFINNAIFRGAGDAATAMRVLWLANGLNIILDPILIFGLGPIPAMGIKGAAIATNIGRGAAVLYQLYLLYQGKNRVSLKAITPRINWKRIMHLVNISLGGIGQMLIAHISWVFMVRIISGFGSEMVAAYTIAIRIIIFALLPSWGLSNAAATLVGQNLGAKHPGRAEKAVWGVAKANAVFLGLLSIVLIIFAEDFIRLFSTDPDLIRHGAECLRIISYGFAFYGVGMVLVQAFNGAGDTATPTKINVVAFWLMEIPLAWFLSTKSSLDENGVYWAIIISETFMTIIALIWFRRGNWKKQKV